VREDGDETGIVRRLPGEVGIALLADKEDSLRRPAAAVRLDPAPTPAVQRASPWPTSLGPRAELGTSSTMLHTSLSAKKIVAGELQ
jgi:hypothetical protein